MLPGSGVVGLQLVWRRQGKQQRGEQFPGLRVGWQQAVSLPLAVDQYLARLGDAQQVHHRPANPGFFTLDHQHPVLALLVLGLLHVQLQRQCQRRLPRGQGRLAGACAQQQGSAQQHQARDKVTLAHVASRAQSCEIIFSRRRASLTNGLRSSQA